MSRRKRNTGPTIRDVAEQAGVSIAAVSYAFNNPSRLSSETRDRILQAAEALGYRPSAIAQSMRSQRTYTLGLILRSRRRQLSDPFFRLLVAGLADQASLAGYYLLLATAIDEHHELETYEDLVRSNRVDGMIVVDTRTQDTRLDFLRQAGFPFVTFGRSGSANGDHPWVDVDGEVGIRLAVDHLVSRGHRRIGFIGLPTTLMCERHRRAGYEKALWAHNLPMDPTLIVEGEVTEEGGHRAMLRLLEATPPPTAVVACSDVMAIGAINAAHARGLHVPDDVAVVGFDDVPIAPHLRPALTTVHQPIYRVGECVVDLLVRTLEGEPIENPHVLLKPSLVIRESA